MSNLADKVDRQQYLIYALVGIVGFGLISAVAGVGPFSSMGGDNGNAPQSPTVEMVNVDSYGIDGKVSFPKTPASADIYLFKQKPEKWGNHVNFDVATATSGLEQGIDYYAKTGQTTDTVKFDDLPSGDYFLYVDDSNYHDVFTTVSQPKEVKKIFAENDKAIKLAGAADMKTTATYGSDNVVLYDGSGNVLGTGADLPTASTNGSQTFKIVRTIEVKTGNAFLGSYDVTSFNANDGIENVDVKVEFAGQSYTKDLKDGASGELADGTSFGEDLVDTPETSPAIVTGDIKVTYTVTATRDTVSTTADDSKLGPGESIFTSGLDDIYGAAVSTATNSYTG